MCNFASWLCSTCNVGIFLIIINPRPANIPLNGYSQPFFFLWTFRSSPIVHVINIAVKNVVVCKAFLIFFFSEFMVISLGVISRMNIFLRLLILIAKLLSKSIRSFCTANSLMWMSEEMGLLKLKVMKYVVEERECAVESESWVWIRFHHWQTGLDYFYICCLFLFCFDLIYLHFY